MEQRPRVLLLTDCRNRLQLAALEAVPGGDLLNERRFALGESQALLFAFGSRT